MSLSAAVLPDLDIARPRYDRAEVQTGIVHLGVGAFHRAHQAVFIDDLLARDRSWGIVGASLRSPGVARALNPQDGLYTLVVRSGEVDALRAIGALQEVLVAPEDPGALIAQMAAPKVRIVSLTITEKGYCSRPNSGGLDLNHPDIIHDLAHPAAPKSAPGFLVAALRARRDADAGPFTVLSCDNLPDNGGVARRVVTDLAAQFDLSLSRWIDDHVSFPSTMVDRIVPATTPADRARLRSDHGLEDAAPVITEPFCQWVIEDDFCAGRPAFEDAGAIMTGDVGTYERMKLRLLNGAHSALAYSGLRRGHRTVAQSISDPVLHGRIEALWSEVIPTLDRPQGLDLGDYTRALLTRFGNETLQHELMQIAKDGTQKLPQRIFDPMRDRLADGAPVAGLAWAVASWLSIATDRQGGAYRYPIDDPMGPVLRPEDHALSARDLLTRAEVFGEDLVQNPTFGAAVLHAYQTLPKG